MAAFWVIRLLVFAHTVVGGCYLPNGTERHDVYDVGNNKHDPCESGEHSMCCNMVKGDECRDGLCWNDGTKVLWRESCTDPTWQSPRCLKLCIDDVPVGDNSDRLRSETDVVVTECTDGTYCCGNGLSARQCCEGGGVRVVDGQVVDPEPSSTVSPSSTGSTVASSSDPTDLPTSYPMPDEGSSSNKPMIIGGAVGGGVGGLLLVAGVAVFVIYKRRQKAKTTAIIQNERSRVLDIPDGKECTELPVEQHMRFELEGENSATR